MLMHAGLESVTSPAFRAGGGETGALMRVHDWSASPIGAPMTWPQPLKTLVGVMLASNQPMFVAWGPERTLLYNDAYIGIIASKHPHALGRDFLKVWHEINDFLLPVVAEAYVGRPVHMEGVELAIERKGHPEVAHFAFSFTPVRDEGGEVGGFFCAAIETTGQVLSDRRRATDAVRQRRLFEQAPGFITILSGPELRFEFVNEAYDRLFGRRGFVGKTVREVFPDLEGQPFFDLLDNAYATGERFVARTIPIRLQATPEAEPADHFLDFIYEPVRDEAGAVTGLFIEGHDVTERVRAEQALTEAERRLSAAVDAAGLSADFRALFEASPTPFLVVAPPDWTIVAANDARLRVTGMTREGQIGRKLFDVFPDDPDDPTADGVRNLTASLERVVATKATDTMAVQRYPVREADGRFVERWWSPVNSPVLGRGGNVALIIHRVEDVTETVRLRGEAEARDQLARDQRAVIDRLRSSEAALRESEARHRFRVELGDALRGLTTPSAIMAAVADRLGPYLGVDQANYYRIDGDRFVITEEWRTAASRGMLGSHALAGFGESIPARLHAGEVLRLDDTRGVEGADAFAAAGMAAVLSAPLRSGGRWAGGFHVHSAAPRAWTDEEAALVRETAERAWAAVEQARAEAELRESELRLRDLNAHLERQVVERARERGRTWEVSPDLLCVFENDDRFSAVNPAWTATLGWTQDELVGALYTELLHPEDAERTTQTLEALQRDLPVLGHANRYRTKDGGWRWLSWVAVPVDGRFYCSARDVTEEKAQAAELALRTAERDQMWETSPDLMVVIDFKGVFRRVNPAWTTLLGYAPEELVGHHVNEFVIPEDHDETTDAYELAASGGRPTIVNRYRHKDSSIRWISWTAAPAGDLTYATGRDITIEKEREAELAQAHEALRQAQKMEAVGQLTGGVAHDFNNLLTIIKSSTDLLRRPGIADERKRRYVDAISDTVDRASKLTGQLLAFARRQALKPEVFDAAERVRAVADMLGTIAGSRIRIVTEIACEPCHVEADASQFETALVNMAVNARDAMQEEGTLTVRVERVPGLPTIRGDAGRAGHHVAVSIADTGVGIPPDRLAQIFEPFFTTKEVGKGTGLGLSQVYGFAKQSGGDIAVQSEVGRGATFTLFLPRFDGTIHDEVATDVKEPPAAEHGRGRRILVVEDNVDVGTFSTQLLRDLGYETTWAANADEALTALSEANGFDAVFSDVVMPGMGGVELGQEIRRLYPGLPVVLTSGYSHVLAEEGRHGFELLHKPYAVEDLSKVLRRVTRRRPALSPTLDASS